MYRVVASSNNPEHWLRERRKLITASDVYKIVHGSSSEYDRLLAEKRGEVEPPDLSRIKVVMAGRYLESGIRRLWSHMSGIRSRGTPYLCVSTKYPWLGATPDGLGWSRFSECAGVVEIKLVTTCDVSERGRLRTEYTRRAVNRWTPEPPEKYRTQHDTQMFVVGKSFGWLVAGFAGSNPVHYPRRFDSRHRWFYELDVIPRLEDFARKARLIQ